MSDNKFVHLHVHSHYSLLDGLGKIPALVKKAVEQGSPALALTDHGVMYGAIEFYLECEKAGIKPIIGVEAYVAPNKLTDKGQGNDIRPFHMTLLAKNYQGYLNLIKLTSIAHLEGYYYKPRIDFDTLSRHKEGLIAATGCLAGEIPRLIRDKDAHKLDEKILAYKELFGKDHYYLELQNHPSIPEQQVVNQALRELSEKHQLPLIITNDIHYVNAEDHGAHDLLVCIQTGKLVSDVDRMRYTGDFSMKDPKDMAAGFPDLPEAMENTVKIADMVDIKIPLGEYLLPKFPLPDKETEESYLRGLCETGLKNRYKEITPEIKTRLEYELSVILKMGFPGYFLMVADMVNYAKDKGIFVGPGRGSGAGSIIAYVLKITDIDPIRYGLLFERFLNPDRISMPDFDVDYEDARRGEVIEHLKEKYGDSHVAGIITFGTIMARAAIRDTGRVLGMAYNDVDVIAKAVPPPTQGRHTPLSESVKEAPELKVMYETNTEAKQLLDWAIQLEGTVRHASQHACAIVISKAPLDQYAPVQAAQGGDIHQVTQYSMGPIEKIGLLKMDLLGLANLTTMRKACEIIEAVCDVKIDIYNIPLEDKKTFELLARGETTGVFQLESSGMKRYLKELVPNRFEDITTMVALYRPGPMQWIDSFIKRKHGKEKIEYLHPLAENSLKETYGIPLYQEQVMQMSKDMSGFTGGQADTLRKAIGKKIPKLMKEMKDLFIEGAVKNGVEKKVAADIFKQLEDFAAYCFNKSHAAGYAMIAYQTAYLKANYPDCFMAALMTSDLNDIDRISIEISECDRMGMTVLPPDINESFSDFAVVKDAKSIRFGLGAIKNVGEGVAKEIVRERKKNGPFATLEEFLTRCSAPVNKKVLESLVKAGALDRFAKRCDLYEGADALVKFAAGDKKTNINQMDIFGQAGEAEKFKLKLPTGKEDKKLYLIWEKELLGLYLSDHPLKGYTSQLEQAKATPIKDIGTDSVGKIYRVAGIPISVKKIITKNNQQMAFIDLEDLTTKIEAVVFPGVFAETWQIWAKNEPVLVQGKINEKDGSLKLLVDKVWLLDGLLVTQIGKFENGEEDKTEKKTYPPKAAAKPVQKSYLVELPSNSSKELLIELKEVLAKYPGDIPVELRIVQNGTTKQVTTKQTVKPSAKLNERVSALLKALVD